MIKYWGIDYVIIGKSFVELLFNRKMRGKLLELYVDYYLDLEIWDRDVEVKVKIKVIVDKFMNVKLLEV